MRQGGIPGSGGTKPANFFKLAKKAGVKWAVMVRDPTHSWYHRGLEEGDTEGFNALVNILKVALPSQPPCTRCALAVKPAKSRCARVPISPALGVPCRLRSTWCSPEMW